MSEMSASWTLRYFSVAVCLVMISCKGVPPEDPVPDWPMMMHDTRWTGYQPIASRPVQKIQFREVMKIPGHRFILVGDVRGGDWLEIVGVTSAHAQVIDLQAGTFQEHLPRSSYHFGLLTDLNGDGRKDIALTRHTHLERPALIGISGEGDILFNRRLDLRGCSSLALDGKGPDGVLYGTIIKGGGLTQRSIFGYQPETDKMLWEYTTGPSPGVVSLWTDSANSVYLTADVRNPSNDVFGYGRRQGKDSYTRDSKLYLPLLGAAGIELVMEPVEGRGCAYTRLWNGNLLSIYSEDKARSLPVRTIRLYDLQGKEIAARSREPEDDGSGGGPSLLLLNLDGEGPEELLLSHQDSGLVTAYSHPDLDVVIEASLGKITLLAAGDLDGDGKPEIVAKSDAGIIVLDNQLNVSCSVSIESPQTAFIVDVDRDGYHELVVQGEDATHILTCAPGPPKMVRPPKLVGPAQIASSPIYDEYLAPPATAWELRYRLEELFPLSSEKDEVIGLNDSKRLTLARRWLSEARELVLQSVYILARDLPGRMGHERTKQFHAVAQVICSLSSELWGDPFPQEILDTYINLGDERERIFTKAFKAWIDHGSYLEEGDRKQALARLEEAVTGFRNLGEEYGESVVLTALAELQRDAGLLNRGLITIEKVINMKRDWYDPAGQSRAERIQADIQRMTGEYEQALTGYLRAKELARMAGIDQLIADAEHALGTLYLALGVMKEARGHLTVALEIQERSHRFDEVARIGRELAEVEYSLGNERRGQNLLERSKKIATDLVLPDLLGEIHLTVAGGLTRDEMSKAVPIYREAIRLGEIHELPVITLRALAGLAAIEISLGRVAEGIRDAGRARDMARNMGLRDIAWRCDVLFASAQEKLGNYDQALQSYLAAINDVESYRSEMTVDRFRYGFLSARLTPLDGALRVLAALDQQRRGGKYGAVALQVMERGRARALSDDFITGRSYQVIEPERIELQKKISLLQGALWRSDLTVDARKQIENLIRDARCKYDGTCRKDVADDTDKLLEASVPRSAEEILEYLRAHNTALLTYHFAEGEVIGLLVWDGSVHIAKLGLVDRIADLSERFRRVLIGSPTWAGARDPGEALSKLLLLPFLNHFPPEHIPIAISGDGPLQRIPFGVIPSPGREVPLIATNPVFRTPSGSVLVSLSERLEKNRAMGMGDLYIGISNAATDPDLQDLGRLNMVTAEIERIGEILNSDEERILVGEKATEDALTTLSPEGCRILHIAAHAGWPAGAATPSVRLSPGANSDGVLTLDELTTLSLPTELVYLSACRTADGEQIRGEGTLGLTRGFLGAGSSAVIASLWEVEDDDSARLATRFYELWHGGLTKSDALSQARSEAWREGVPPRTWAGYMLEGLGVE